MKKLFLFFFILLPEASIYLFNVIVWRFSKKQYLNKYVVFKGKHHQVIGETYHHFYLEDTGTSFLKDDYKSNNRYLVRTSQYNTKLYLLES